MLPLTEQLFRIQPAELVLTPGIAQEKEICSWLQEKLPECTISRHQPEEGTEYFAQHFPQEQVFPLVENSVEALLDYLHATIMADLSHINSLKEILMQDFMGLDVTAVRNLELVRNMHDGSKRGTLLGVLDFTNTSMGARKLRKWIECPLFGPSSDL